MSASFYDILKYAKTGIASPDMTGYDKLRALAMAGGGKKTLTGIPPLSFKSNGKPLISWSMLGNGQQTGTPTPDNPVMPEFVGDKTYNLYNNESSEYIANKYLKNTGEIGDSQGWRVTDYIPVSGSNATVVGVSGSSPAICAYDTNKQFLRGISYNGLGRATINISDAAYVRFSVQRSYVDGAMVYIGEYDASKSYIPYGYKIPLTCAGQTVPFYLEQTQTVRRIKKLVLTSTTVNWTYDSEYNGYTLGIADSLIVGVRLTPVACSHFVPISDGRSIGNVPNNAIYSGSIGTTKSWYIKTTDYATASSFKQFLDDELAAGTPVTVWYVLATPTTGIVNEPLAKIGDYADELNSTDAAVTIPTAKGQNTLTVDTPIQPSEMSITYRG